MLFFWRFFSPAPSRADAGNKSLECILEQSSPHFYYLYIERFGNSRIQELFLRKYFSPAALTLIEGSKNINQQVQNPALKVGGYLSQLVRRLWIFTIINSGSLTCSGVISCLSSARNSSFIHLHFCLCSYSGLSARL
jgi:hypothetical protein